MVYVDLLVWLIEDVAGFWVVVWDYFGIVVFGDCAVVFANDWMLGAVWFLGVRLNYVD